MDEQNLFLNLSKSGSYFVYELDALAQHAGRLSKGAAKIFFACKANPLSAIISTLHKSGFSVDVASEGELLQALACGVPGNEIIMTGPAKPERLMRLGLENKIYCFVIESEAQLKLLQYLAKEYSYTPNVLLRLQLKWQLEDEKSGIGGNKVTPFGMDIETAKRALANLKLPFLGFHVFQWNNILSLPRLRRIWTDTITACKKLTTDFKVLDVGGGLGIPYIGEAPLEWDKVNDTIMELKAEHNIPEFWLELGRYIIGPYCRYATSVVDVKQTYDRDILVLEGGINHMARSALANTYFPVELLRKSTKPEKIFSLHGPLCTSMDFLGEHLLPEDVKEGDIIVFKQTGAYGFTESMPFFLCHRLPGEAIIEQGRLRIIRETQPAGTWLK